MRAGEHVRWLSVGLIVTAAWVFSPAALATDEKSIKGFTEAIIKLAPTVDPAEAEAVSTVSHHTSRELKKEYRAVGPAVFQNFLVNIGARQRGYCAHYARDIGTKLKELRLKTLYLHWGAADAGTHLEHNVIIVTAPDQDYRTGYIIDGWRNAGRLCWWPVLKDSSYVWKEDLQETAWLHDYELVPQKTPLVSKTVALQSKAAVQPKSSPQPRAAVEAKPLVPRKTQTAAATIEIKG
ncbi:MAG TPA: hypothetical protein VGM62_19230 [Chthoniobacterales bacterium]